MVNQFIEGTTLNFNKPIAWTSADLSRKVHSIIRRTFNLKKIKVGHAGTLDPLATGVVVICTGKNTKKIEEIQNLEKEYITKIKLGETTPSFDLETEVDNVYETKHINLNKVEEVLVKFETRFFQIPPIYSAKRIDGKRAYEFARKGKDVEIKKNEIEIYKIDIINFELPYLTIKVLCSKGTYIRSLARDIGIELNSGAHLVELQRTKIGNYTLNNALSIAEFEKNFKNLQTF